MLAGHPGNLVVQKLLQDDTGARPLASVGRSGVEPTGYDPVDHSPVQKSSVDYLSFSFPSPTFSFGDAEDLILVFPNKDHRQTMYLAKPCEEYYLVRGLCAAGRGDLDEVLVGGVELDDRSGNVGAVM